MTVKDYLLNKTDVKEVVVFNLDGWDIGATVIDYEDLFISSLSLWILEKEVSRMDIGRRNWATDNVTVLCIK